MNFSINMILKPMKNKNMNYNSLSSVEEKENKPLPLLEFIKALVKLLLIEDLF